jgi:guanylate cyclase
LAGVWKWLTSAFERIGADPGDSPELQLKKGVLVAFAFLIGTLAILWGALYTALGEPLAGVIPWTYAVASLASLIVFAVTHRYHLFRVSQLVLILLLPFLLQLVLGGFVNASAVILWSLLAPLGAMLMSGRSQAVRWFAAYVGLVVAVQLAQPFVEVGNTLSNRIVLVFFVMNIVGVSSVTFVTLHYFVGQKDRALALLGLEQEKSERLLLNVLPKEIAALLKDDGHVIAQHYPAVSVLFADIVGFTPLSAELQPEEMVTLLNEVFSHFDSLVAKYQCEKIRTIGDNYMVACGLPIQRPDHAQAMARMALEMNGFVSSVESPGMHRLQFRLGINSGPVVAGVIGRAKFQYDIWGDTVNVASRMESHGVPGRIQITEATYGLIKDAFVCEPRGPIEVKGKGIVQTWFLVGERDQSQTAAQVTVRSG